MDIDIASGECYLADFEKLSHRAKALIFSCIFDVNDFDFNYTSILNKFICSGFDYSYCKSPIEELFAVAYDIRLAQLGFPYTEMFALWPQEEIKANGNTYYADFLVKAISNKYFQCDRNFMLVVECDGHDFHEKTKEQVERRNNRDMDLKAEGYDVLHFSGSQIYNDPFNCADKTFNYLHKMAGEVRYGNL